METVSPHDSIYVDLLKPDGIRLLELYPGPAEEIPLMGSLILTTLSACEEDLVNSYTALSYTEETKEIDETAAQKELRRAVETDLCSYPWFSRGWIFQELVVSKDPRIQCGKFRLRWDDLMAVVEPFLTKTGPSRHLQGLHEVRSKGLHGDNRNMYKLVTARTGAHVTDPRDMFFSLVGLASDHEEVSKFLVPDYGKSAREVYIAAARYILDRGALRWFLLEARPWAAKSISLPSWVPEWEIHTPHRKETDPMLSSPSSLDEALLVRELHNYGVVERLTDVIPHESGSPSSVWWQATSIGRNSDWNSDWERFVDPVKNTVLRMGDDHDYPDWPHGGLWQVQFQGVQRLSLEPDAYLPPCRLALIVHRYTLQPGGGMAKTYYTMLVPANVALGDSFMAFRKFLQSSDFGIWPPPDTERCYGFRRSLEKTFETTITEYGPASHHEFVGLYPTSFPPPVWNSATGVILAFH
ncbi:uncharacterized protein PG986_003169 [Apiospora aurea]|uniref:Heterokaryon incompatibility domain-containing protein n=1 Tax=Apiospora aurea TaxID=335848 RepID=A0ABR1QQX2_9PEZI